MIPLLFSSILALGIIFERVYTVYYLYKSIHRKQIEQILLFVKQSKTARAIETLQTLKSALTQFYLAILAEPDIDKKEQIAVSAGDNTLFYLTRRLSMLAVIGSVAPLMGLLGTVLGMIRVFSKIAHTGQAADISLLAAGIWEALITTAVGMIIAIPIMIIHYLISRQIQEYAHFMRHDGDRLIAIFAQKVRAA